MTVRPLPSHGWKGWWHKANIFAVAAAETTTTFIYIDLDTIIVNSLDKLVGYATEFAAATATLATLRADMLSSEGIISLL
mgnify:CR=1 FL=1